MAEPLKKPAIDVHTAFHNANFPTFKVSVPAPTKPLAASSPKAQPSGAQSKASK